VLAFNLVFSEVFGRGRQMRRRKFITLIGGAAAVWPLAARAQQQGMPVVGFMSARSPAEAASDLAAFRHGLGQTGHFEGKNVTIEYRWAEGHYDRLPAMATELVARQVAVIAAVGGEPSGLAAKAATTTIPIVCSLGGDAVKAGLVTQLNRPGGNITGVSILGSEMGPKRLEFAHQLVPNASTLAVLINSKFPLGLAEARDMEAAAHSLGLQITVLDASSENEIDRAFAVLAEHKVDVLIINTDPFLLGQRQQIVELAARRNIPTVYFLREFVDAGGLMSYGPSVANSYRQAGIYVGRILKGENVGELPVVQPTKFDLVINLRSAKSLGLEIPTNLLVRADDVIE
jgi:putative tryptophan/tyrosine transport system substrate-binding protein